MIINYQDVLVISLPQTVILETLAQTYFAIQTRKQELSEKEYSELTEDEKRFYQRNLARKGNYSLNVVGKNVRNAIKQNGSVMPDDLPTPEKSLKELERKNDLINI